VICVVCVDRKRLECHFNKAAMPLSMRGIKPTSHTITDNIAIQERSGPSIGLAQQIAGIADDHQKVLTMFMLFNSICSTSSTDRRDLSPNTMLVLGAGSSRWRTGITSERNS
jgi:hypothetical protein